MLGDAGGYGRTPVSCFQGRLDRTDHYCGVKRVQWVQMGGICSRNSTLLGTFLSVKTCQSEVSIIMNKHDSASVMLEESGGKSERGM